jgi:ADP-ribose pyrophosphatase YjhB (NUDIX family)
MTRVLVPIWKSIRGVWQWYILWLAHWKFIIGVSAVIVDENGQVLLLRHRYWKTGSWGLPSGYANQNERLEETIAREVREETGYIVKATKLLRIVSGFKLRLEVSYKGELVGGEEKIDSGEIIEARFFPIDQLPEGLLLSHRDIIGLAFPTHEFTF